MARCVQMLFAASSVGENEGRVYEGLKVNLIHNTAYREGGPRVI